MDHETERVYPLRVVLPSVVYGPFRNTTNITFNWGTTNASIGTLSLRAEVGPVPEEQNTEDNVKTVTTEVKKPPQ